MLMPKRSKAALGEGMAGLFPQEFTSDWWLAPQMPNVNLGAFSLSHGVGNVPSLLKADEPRSSVGLCRVAPISQSQGKG